MTTILRSSVKLQLVHRCKFDETGENQATLAVREDQCSQWQSARVKLIEDARALLAPDKPGYKIPKSVCRGAMK